MTKDCCEKCIRGTVQSLECVCNCHSKTESWEEAFSKALYKAIDDNGEGCEIYSIDGLTNDLKSFISSEIKAAEVRGMEKAEKEFSKIRGFTENQHDWVDTCDVYKMFQQLRQKLIGK